MALHVDQYHASSYTNTRSDSPKPVLILIHGGALSNRMYKDLIPILLKQGYDIVAPDLPGHGSSSETGAFSFEKSTKLLNQEIQKLKTDDKKYRDRKWIAIGISLGAQAVLDLISHYPSLVDTAIVSGATINPPDDRAQWEMPHMPSSEDWITLMTEDVNRMDGGMDGAGAVQKESFAFQFTRFGELEKQIPPILVMIGEHDVAMAKRDFNQLFQLVEEVSPESQSMVLQGAWHNHSIDVPEQFAGVVDDWVKAVFPSSVS